VLTVTPISELFFPNTISVADAANHIFHLIFVSGVTHLEMKGLEAKCHTDFSFLSSRYICFFAQGLHPNVNSSSQFFMNVDLLPVLSHKMRKR